MSHYGWADVMEVLYKNFSYFTPGTPFKSNYSMTVMLNSVSPTITHALTNTLIEHTSY